MNGGKAVESKSANGTINLDATNTVAYTNIDTVTPPTGVILHFAPVLLAFAAAFGGCCVLAMQGKFVKENPVMAQVLTKCVMDAYMYIYDNKDEAAQIMLDEGMVSGDLELTKYMLDQQNWSVSYDDTKKTIENVAEDYIKAGIISSDWTVDKVVETAWQPLASKESAK